MSPFRPDVLTAPAGRRPRRTALAGAATALLAGAVTVLSVAAPSARPGLVSVAPPDRTATAGSASRVTLTFAAEVDPGRSHVTVTTAAGADATAGPTRADGRQVFRPVRADAPGEYLVGYHVVLAGGGELSGTSRFTVRDPATDGADSATPDSATPDSATPDSATSDSATSDGAAGHAHDPLGPAALVPLAVVTVVVIGAVAGYWRARWRGAR